MVAAVSSICMVAKKSGCRGNFAMAVDGIFCHRILPARSIYRKLI